MSDLQVAGVEGYHLSIAPMIQLARIGRNAPCVPVAGMRFRLSTAKLQHPSAAQHLQTGMDALNALEKASLTRRQAEALVRRPISW